MGTKEENMSGYIKQSWTEAKVHCDTQNDVKACCTLQRAIQIIGAANLHHF